MKDVRQTLTADVTEAARPLRAPENLSDEDIHETRKALKRARAGLRLLREAAGREAYAVENHCLRDTARPLARARDLAVMVEALDEMIADETRTGHRAVLRALRGKLSAEHDDTLGGLRAAPDTGGLASLLAASLARIGAWGLPYDPIPTLCEGYERAYRKARRALKDCASHPSTVRLHEWRKQVKHLNHALRVLEARPAGRTARFMERADELGDILGEDHDLAVLAEGLGTLGVEPEVCGELQDEILERRSELQQRAFKTGRHLFRRKPAKFVRRLDELSAAALPEPASA